MSGSLQGAKPNAETPSNTEEPLFGSRFVGSQVLQWRVGRQRKAKWRGEDTNSSGECPVLQLMEGIFLDNWNKDTATRNTGMVVADVDLSRHLGLVLVLNGEALKGVEWKVSTSPLTTQQPLDQVCFHRLEMENYNHRLVLAGLIGQSTWVNERAKFGSVAEWETTSWNTETMPATERDGKSDDGNANLDYNKSLLSLTRITSGGNEEDVLQPCVHPASKCRWDEVRESLPGSTETFNDWSDSEPSQQVVASYLSCQRCHKRLMRRSKGGSVTPCCDLRWFERNKDDPPTPQRT